MSRDEEVQKYKSSRVAGGGDGRWRGLWDGTGSKWAAPSPPLVGSSAKNITIATESETVTIVLLLFVYLHIFRFLPIERALLVGTTDHKSASPIHSAY
jgi:hypothetical protein